MGPKCSIVRGCGVWLALFLGVEEEEEGFCFSFLFLFLGLKKVGKGEM